MLNKTCLITGATSGIGRKIAFDLAIKGANVGIIARNPGKAENTRKSIIRSTGNSNIEIFIADFASLDQVKDAAEKINSRFSKIDVLVNNAGIILSDKREISKEGYELTLTINHLSPFLLTASLFEKLKKSVEARIINTSSVAHTLAKFNLEDIHLKKGYSSFIAYSNSKLYNLMLTIELAKRLTNFPGVTTNAYHPGIVSSNFGQNSGGLLGFFYKAVNPFLADEKKGAETGIYLASDPEAIRYKGKYFVKKRVVTPHLKHISNENCRKLWELSEKLTGVNFLN